MSSLAAEQNVIGALLLNNAGLAEVSDWLTPGDFADRALGIVYAGMLQLASADKPFDAVTLTDWFADQGKAGDVGGIGALVDLANNTASSRNVVAHAEIVMDHARRRRIADIGARLSNERMSRDVDGAVTEIIRDLTRLTDDRYRVGLQPSKQLVSGFVAELIERYQQGAATLGIKTPWPVLDDRLGGWRKSTLYVVGARPSMGKSVFGCQAAMVAALAGKRVALFSAEMTEQECIARMAAALVDMPYAWVDNPGRPDPEAETNWSKVTQAMEALSRAPFLIDATPAPTISQIMARAGRAHLQAPLDLIVIDHLHDLKIENPQNMRHELGEITQGAKTLAKRFDCPVILLSQLRRTDAGKRPSLQDLRESGEIEQKADVVLFLHRPDYYHQDDQPGVLEVIPAKGRNIETGSTMFLRHRFDRMRLDPWTGELPERPQAQNVRRIGKWRP